MTRTLEVRRHAHTKKGSERGRGSHLSREGVEAARAVGQQSGPFDVVKVSQVPRTLETALAMGFSVDDVVDVALDEAFWNEVGKHDHWLWSGPFDRYRDLLAEGGAIARVANAQRDAWTTTLEALPDGGAALFVSHGHATESGLVACFIDHAFDEIGAPFGNLEGFRARYADGRFSDLEVLRVG